MFPKHRGENPPKWIKFIVEKPVIKMDDLGVTGVFPKDSKREHWGTLANIREPPPLGTLPLNNPTITSFEEAAATVTAVTCGAVLRRHGVDGDGRTSQEQ